MAFPSFTEKEAAQLADLGGIEECDSALQVENFSAKFFEKDIFFQIVHLHNSFMIWIGDSPALSDISLAMKLPNVRSKADQYSVTSVDGFRTDDEASRVALHLSKRMDRVCYVSYNLTFLPGQFEFVEKCLISRLPK